MNYRYFIDSQESTSEKTMSDFNRHINNLMMMLRKHLGLSLETPEILTLKSSLLS